MRITRKVAAPSVERGVLKPSEAGRRRRAPRDGFTASFRTPRSTLGTRHFFASMPPKVSKVLPQHLASSI